MKDLADKFGLSNSPVTDIVDVEGDAIIVMKCDAGSIKLERLTGDISDSVTQPPPIDAWETSPSMLSLPS